MAPTSHVPERTCVGCRLKAPRDQLLRLVVRDDGEVTVDARAIMPGRGAWVHPDPRCLDLAQRKRALVRALRLNEPPDVARLYDLVAAAATRAEVPPAPHRAGSTDEEGG